MEEYAITKQRKAEVAVLFSDKVDFKTRKIVRDKREQYIMRKQKILQENITTVCQSM